MDNKEQIKQLTSDPRDLYAYAHITVMPMDKNYVDQYGLFEIEEEKVLKVWLQNSNSNQNDYDPAIEKAKFYKRAGLTPVFYSNPAGSLLYITSKEFMESRFC